MVIAGTMLLLLALFLPWVSTNRLPTNYRAGVSLWGIYSLVMGGDIGYYTGGVITQDYLLTIVLVMYPLAFLLTLLLLRDYDFSAAYPAGIVFAAVAMWLCDMYIQGFTLAPGSATGPYLAIAGGVLIIAPVNGHGGVNHLSPTSVSEAFNSDRNPTRNSELLTLPHLRRSKPTA